MYEGEPSTTYRELIFAAINAKEAGDKTRELQLWLEASKVWLKEKFGIEDLTTIEGAHLRRIAEKVIEEQAELESERDRLLQTGDREGAWRANLATYDDLNDEVVERWLLELYEINRKQIPGTIDEPFKEYLKRLREKSHKP